MNGQKYIPNEKGKECDEWLHGSTLEQADRIRDIGGQALWLVASKDGEQATMFITKSLDDTKDYLVMMNKPNTTTDACKEAGFVISGKNIPTAARWFIEQAGIDNPNGLKI